MMRILSALALAAALTAPLTALADPPWTVTSLETTTDFGVSGAFVAGDRVLWTVGHQSRVAPVDGSAPPQAGPPVDELLDASGPLVAGTITRSPSGETTLYAGSRTMKPFGPPARTVPVADVDDGRGRSALAFASGTDGAARRVELAVRRRGRKEPASRTDRLSRAGTIEAVAVSVGASGAVLTAWVRDGRIEARIRTRKGELRPVQRLATGAGIRQLHADLGEDGRAVVAWRERTLLSKVSGDVQNTVRAAVSGRKGRFARARLLDTFIGDQAVSGAGVRALAQRDRQLVAWNGSARARAAFRRRAGFGAPVELEPTDAVYRRGGGLEDLVARGGSAIAVYVAMRSTYSVGPAIEHRIDVASRPTPVVR